MQWATEKEIFVKYKKKVKENMLMSRTQLGASNRQLESFSCFLNYRYNLKVYVELVLTILNIYYFQIDKQPHGMTELYVANYDYKKQKVKKVVKCEEM